MDPKEAADVYRIQCGLRAVKPCPGCKRDLPVAEFGWYGRRYCKTCLRPATPAAIDGQRYRVGVGT